MTAEAHPRLCFQDLHHLEGAADRPLGCIHSRCANVLVACECGCLIDAAETQCYAAAILYLSGPDIFILLDSHGSTTLQQTALLQNAIEHES